MWNVHQNWVFVSQYKFKSSSHCLDLAIFKKKWMRMTDRLTDWYTEFVTKKALSVLFFLVLLIYVIMAMTYCWPHCWIWIMDDICLCASYHASENSTMIGLIIENGSWVSLTCVQVILCVKNHIWFYLRYSIATLL